jgi:phage FluMu protein Com
MLKIFFKKITSKVLTTDFSCYKIKTTENGCFKKGVPQMKANYSNFLNENRKCGRDLKTNDTAKALFTLLSKDQNIISMIDAADAGKPAISPVVLVVESYCDKHPSSDFDLANGQRRTVVGCMIKTILSRFGYEPVKPASRTQKELSRAIGAEHFVSGTCYVYEPLAPATMRVVRKVSLESAVFSLERDVHCPYCKSMNSIDLQTEYSTFFDTQSDKERGLDISFEHICIACDEKFKVAGYMIVFPLCDIEREEIDTFPIEIPPKREEIINQ